MNEPTRAEVDGWTGTALLEFGASWCPICQAARPGIDEALRNSAPLKHVWVEDGKGKRLGRSYRVKLWPTLILLRDGEEVGRVVRPANRDTVEALLADASS